MNCYTHHDNGSVGICKACQKAVCHECAIDTGRGLACSDECAKEVADINTIIDKSKLVYSIGTNSKLPSSNVIMFLFFGLLFTGISTYQYFSRERVDFIAISMAIGFLAIGVFSHIRTRKINFNC